MASLDDVVEEAASHPVEVSVDHPLSYLFLEQEVAVLEDDMEFELLWDDPARRFGQNVVLKEQQRVGAPTFPKVTLDHTPVSPALNTIIGERYHDIAEYLTTQRDIKSQLLQQITDETVVVLLIADGLGYADLKEWDIDLSYEPCLVNGPTITPIGYRNVIYGHDNDPLVNQLTKRGFVRLRGYSYWDEGSYNDLNDAVFTNFSEINRVRTSQQIISHLKDEPLEDSRTFIQISRQVLDPLAHSGKELQPSDIEHELTKLVEDIESLCSVLADQVESYLVVVTADHGILWRKDFEPNMRKVSTRGKSKMRYAPRRIGVDEGAQLVDVEGSTYTVFEYPYVADDFDADQGGVHGGLSYQESIVPLVTKGTHV